MANTEIKLMIRKSGISQWQVAEAIGISEYTLIRWFRHELTEEQRVRVLTAINKLTAEKK